MSYTLTPNYGLKKPTPDSDGDAWGGHTNENWDLVDTLFATLSNTALPVQAHGSVGGALTIDFSVVRAHTVTAAADITLTLTTATPTAVFITGLLVVTQDATGSRSMSWPPSVRWQGGFSPSLSTVPGSIDILQFSTFDGGATWFGAIALQAPPS